KIKDSGAHLLLVAFGAPRQDLWINEHLDETNAKVAIGVGGLFDFYSGRIPRAPVWMREIGMEWLYRLLQEPGRLWKRYLIGNGIFLSRVIWEKFFPKNRD
ncbi:MAG: WecB/TagA/CpsF family glycosyltransferase, partial [Syntrophaceae bacterium]|nr:WecB/TagA/CpsF family glycosyltransferase [Syntrophaceae bacterium]